MNNLVKKDCFAFRKDDETEYCSCLKQLYCETEECNFYKKRKEKEN